MKQRLDSLEVGRAIAAIAVMLDHFFLTADTDYAADGASLFWGLTAPGALAVQYFFVLSGFVMLTAHYGDFGNWSAPFRFWWRRACRIYPIFWIAMLLTVWIYHIPLTRVLFEQQFLLKPRLTVDLLYPAWSLHFEVAFYIMFGLILLPRIGLVVLVCWVAVVMLDWCPAPGSVPQVYHFWQNYILSHLGVKGLNCFVSAFELYFFCGLAGAWCFKHISLTGFWSGAVAAFGALLVIMSQGGSHYGTGYPSGWWQLGCASGFASLIFGLGALEKADILSVRPWVARLGAMSYPIFVINAPVINFCDRFIKGAKLHDVGLYSVFAIEMILMAIVTPILTFWIDRPVQRFLRRPFLTRWGGG